MIYLQLFLGVVLLTVGGEALIRGSLGAARKFGVSPLLSGIVIVGFGTSAPELVVSVDAAIQRRPDIAIGNVVGSNIGNVLLILGVCSLIRPLNVKPTALRRDALTGLVASMLFIALVGGRALGRGDSMVLLAAFLAYLAWAYRDERLHHPPAALLHEKAARELSIVPQRLSWTVASIVAGLVFLVVGSRLLLNGAVGVAQGFGLSEALIGLIFVSVGTSLPEFSISVIATLRKHSDVAVGNVLGSNVFNLLAILGVSALFQPLPVHERILSFDQWILLGTSLVLLVFLFTGKRLSRWEGGTLLAGYVGYCVASFAVFSA